MSCIQSTRREGAVIWRHGQQFLKALMSSDSNYHLWMKKTLRDVVANNIARIMDDPACPLTQESVGRRSGIPQRTVGRLRNGSTAASLSTLEAIAKGLEVEPWQLLVPDFDPKHPPVPSSASLAETSLKKPRS